MEEKKTQCACDLAGFCNRHGINKSAHMHKLCQNNPKYFKMWEECRGPGQGNGDCGNIKNVTETVDEPQNDSIKNINNEPVKEKVKDEKSGKKDELPKLPSLLQQAKNLATATAEHAKNGFKNAQEEEKQRRLSICKECPHLIPDSMRCGQCGCYLETKAAWASSKCPIGKW